MQQLTTIVKGSIQAMGGDETLAIMDAKIVIICDRSSSMIDRGKDGRPAYQIEDDIVRKIQEENPGKIVIMSFSDMPEVNTNGVLPEPNGGTNYVPALEMAQNLIGVGLRGIFITDGQPAEDRQSIWKAATPLMGKLDVVYVGREGDSGDKLARDLAKYLKGQFAVNDLGKKSAKLLEETINRLMLTAG